MCACEMLTPGTLAELESCLRGAPKNTRLLGGGTDLVIQMKEGKESPGALLDVFGVRELHSITQEGECLRIGAACTYTELAEHAAVKNHFPALRQAAAEVGSQQVRNRGTIGGNLANASPAGDAIPVLLALNASVQVLDGAGTLRQLSIPQLVLGVNKTALAPGEAIVHILIPMPPSTERSAFVKLGARAKVTIAKISLAIAFLEENGVIRNAAVALGAVGERAFLSENAAQLLDGKPATQALFKKLGAVLSEDIMASIPSRESMPYKKEAVKGLAEDLWLRLACGAPENKAQ